METGKDRCQVSGIRCQVGMGKRGLISNFIAFFGATIFIILILIVYVIGGAVVKKLDRGSADVAIYDESSVEIDNVFDYSERYVLWNNVKFLVAKGSGVDEAVNEVNRLVVGKKEEENRLEMEGLQQIR